MDTSFVIFLGKSSAVLLLLFLISWILLLISRKLKLSKKIQFFLEFVCSIFCLFLTITGGIFIIGLFCYATSPLLIN